MAHLRWLDISIVIIYILGLVVIGLRFSRKQTTTEHYFVAKRSIPAWAMGISVMTTLVTCLTFVSYPGSAYAGDWSGLVPGLLVVGVLGVVGTIIIPFYRHAVGMSAYEYFGKRFGLPARVYSSIAFAIAHFSKMGFVFYLLALTINSVTGWNMDHVIAGAGLLTIFYTLKGGLEAVIWTDVLQGVVLWAGVFISLGYLLFLPSGGPHSVFALAAEHHKFSLGTWSFDFSKPTVPVLVIYGFFWYLQKYTADQTIVQRYLIAKSDRAALRGVGLGAFLCAPAWTLFMLIGTCTWAFYRLTGEKLPEYVNKADQMYPYFISTHLPAGMAGLLLASLLGSAMCALASDLNSFAVVGVEDVYRLIRPNATDRQRLRMGKNVVAGCGAGCILTAVVLAHMKGSALSMWFTVSAVASGGLAGLFLLAFLSSRASRRGAYCGIVASLLFTLWASLASHEKPIINLGRYNYAWHDYMIGAIGHFILIGVGYTASLLLPRDSNQDRSLSELTIWGWLKSSNRLVSAAQQVSVISILRQRFADKSARLS